MLEMVTLVLERAEGPMRAREIHAAAEELAGEMLLWTSVKAALAAGASGRSRRFQRVQRSHLRDRASSRLTTRARLKQGQDILSLELSATGHAVPSWG